MIKYDLLKEPWIPVLNKDGSNKDVSLASALLSEEPCEICGEKPVITLAIYRLLIGITATAQKQNGFDTKKVRVYLEERKDSFDLFSEKRPFLQNRNLTLEDPKTTDRAATFLANDKNVPESKTIYDHSVEGTPQTYLTPAQCARWMLAALLYTVRLHGNNETNRPSPTYGQLTTGSCFVLLGKTVRETIELNLPPSFEGRLPWERALDKPQTVRKMEGPLDILVGQARSLLLSPPIDGLVREVRVSGGTTYSDFNDYMWVERQGKEKLEKVRYFADRRIPPSVLRYLPEISLKFDLASATCLWVTGIANDKSNIHFSPEERFDAKNLASHVKTVAKANDLLEELRPRVYGMSKSSGNAETVSNSFSVTWYQELERVLPSSGPDWGLDLWVQLFNNTIQKCGLRLYKDQVTRLLEIIEYTIFPERKADRKPKPKKEPKVDPRQELRDKLAPDLRPEHFKNANKPYMNGRSILSVQLAKIVAHAPNRSKLVREKLDSYEDWSDKALIQVICECLPQNCYQTLVQKLATSKREKLLQNILDSKTKSQLIQSVVSAVKAVDGVNYTALHEWLEHWDKNNKEARAQWVSEYQSALI